MVCPTRDRPQQFLELAESFEATSSENAVLVGYVDDDNAEEYRKLPLPPRVQLYVDRRLGPVHSVNRICDLYRDKCRIYGVAPDDSRFLVKGWDVYVRQTIDSWPGRIGVLSASHNQGDFVNLPYVSREWIELCGWFAYPEAFHFIWDTVLEILGEATRIVYSDPEKFKVFHGYMIAANKAEHHDRDAVAFLMFCVNERRALVKKIREAMADAGSSGI